MGLETLRVDLRAALRTLRNAPGFTAVAVLSLGIGIGANTTVFSAINALLLRPLPVSAPDELVSVYRRRSGLRWASMSFGEFGDVRGSARSFRGLAAFTAPGLQMSVRERVGQAVATPAALVSG
ncbi:MAG TPA: hypothetical protein VK864_19980, partial [Longimicrobiales bacterium]|nr:hypothetical protein [Longimicrobiales bacterium]